MATGIKLIGTKKDDFLHGTYRDDTIDGGAGNDILYGGSDEGSFAGYDTFIFGKKHGTDTIISNHQSSYSYDSFAGGSRVAMTKDVSAKDVKLNIVKVMIAQEDAPDAPQWNLKITLKSNKDVLIIEDYLYVGKYGRGEIHFTDGTIWTYADIVSKVSGDADFKQYVALNGPLTSYLTGHGGNDTLVGTNGAEYLDGSSGNDSISALGGDDSVFGGLGNDTVDGGSGDDFINDDFGNNVLTGGAGADSIYSGDGNDILSGGDGSDDLYSGSGNDTINGGSGDDTLGAYGGAGTHSVLSGGAGDDYLFSLEGSALLDGGDGHDNLSSTYGGNDTLLGGSGNDTLSAGTYSSTNPGNAAILDGGAGDDKLTGFNGNQTYVFNKGYGSDTVYAWHDDRPGYYNENIGLNKGDVVQFGSFVKVTDIKLDIVKEIKALEYDPDYSQAYWHLDMSINGTNDNLRIDDYLTRTPADRGVITFADGTSWSYADVLSMVATDVDTVAFNDYIATLPAVSTAQSADLFLV